MVKQVLSEVLKPGTDTPSYDLTPQPTADRKKALELGASLIDSTGTGLDGTLDEPVNLPVIRPMNPSPAPCPYA